MLAIVSIIASISTFCILKLVKYIKKTHEK